MAKLGAEQDCGNRGKMSRQKTLIIFLICLLTLSTCGLDEIYYLPQVSEGYITTDSDNVTTSVKIDTPSLLSYSYAIGYVIFYKIYICNDPTESNNHKTNPRIISDYNYLYPYTDSSKASSIPSLATFSSRGFYELDFTGKSTVLSKNGESFVINFPNRFEGDFPYVSYYVSGVEIFKNDLLRSKNGFDPKPDDKFLNTLSNSNDLNISTNSDVSKENDASYAYTLMYIVAVGQNTETFSRIYGKPTFISLFRLPDSN